MRLVTFKQEGMVGIGAMTDEGVVELHQADSGLPTEMVELLAGGQELLERAAQAVERFRG